MLTDPSRARIRDGLARVREHLGGPAPAAGPPRRSSGIAKRRGTIDALRGSQQHVMERGATTGKTVRHPSGSISRS